MSEPLGFMVTSDYHGDNDALRGIWLMDMLDGKRTLFLDMDGTLLDLAFDNDFWRIHLPREWGRLRGFAPDRALTELQPHFTDHAGTLNWYCLDFWCDLLDFDVVALKERYRADIRYLPGAEEFLLAARRRGLRLALVTNAHRTTLAIKDSATGLSAHFDATYSAHDFGYAKEQPGFWSCLAAEETLDRETTLFIDDTVTVLDTARRAGLAVLAVRTPDSREPARQIDDLPAVDRVADLLSGPGSGTGN